MRFICLVTLREDVWYSFHGPECSNMAEKLKKVFFQNVPNGVRVLPEWGSSFAGMGFELCRQGVPKNCSYFNSLTKTNYVEIIKDSTQHKPNYNISLFRVLSTKI